MTFSHRIASRTRRALVAAAALATLAAAGTATAQTKTLYIGMNGGNMEKAYTQYVFPAFEKLHGAKVVVVPGTSSDILAKAAAELVAKHKPASIEALGALAYEQDGFGPTLEDVRKGLIGKIGENMSFRRFQYFSGSKLASYLHGSRIGVVVEFEGDEVAAKDVAMHIAAMKPVALTSADVPADLIAKERSVAEGKADEANKELIAAGKPAQSAEITAKRIDGAVQKYLKEVSLADQVFVKAADGKQTVAQMLKAANTTVKSFTLYVVGEGIEKKVDDFAAEVAAQVAAAKAAA